MNKNSAIVITCFTLLLSLLISENLFSRGLDNSAIGAKGPAMGRAFTAVADDSSAVFYNPAGLVYIENDFDIVISGLITNVAFENKTQNKTNTINGWVFIPGAFVSYRIDDFALGFGFYIPFGGGGAKYDNYDNKGWNNGGAMWFFNFNLSIAYKFSKHFSIGLGLNVLYGNLSTDVTQNATQTYNVLLFDLLLDVVARTKQDMKGLAYGANLGIMIRPIKELSIGILIRSPVTVKLKGTVEVNVSDINLIEPISIPSSVLDSLIGGMNYKDENAVYVFTLPFYFNIGVAVKIIPDLTLALDFSYQMWSMCDKQHIHSSEDNLKRAVMQGYKDSFYIGFGAEYRNLFLDGLDIRGGVVYDHTSTEIGKYAEIPYEMSMDIPLLGFSLGTSYDIDNSVEIYVAFMYSIGLEEIVDEKSYYYKVMNILTGVRVKL